MTLRATRFATWIAVLCSLFLIAAVSAGCKKRRAKHAEKVEKQLSVTGAGSALERVTSEDVEEMHPAISPDGKILLFEVRVYETHNGRVTTVEKQNTLVGVNPNTRAQRTLYTSTNSFSNHPCWLPDQSSYVYTSNSPGQWSLVRALTSSPNSAVNVIASGEVAPDASWPSVSPDGERVTFSVAIRGQNKVAIVGMDGSRLTLLGEGKTPAWSPDSTLVAFARDVNGISQLFLVDPATGTGLVQLTSGEWDNDSPSWSPDGQFLVFSTNRGAGKRRGDVARNLFIINKDGTNLTQLTDGDSLNVTPVWGADNWIYFASDQSGNYDIWRLKPAGKYGNLQSPKAAGTEEPPAAPTTAPPTAPTTAPPATTGSGCEKDTDCKGDRICVGGDCVAPKTP